MTDAYREYLELLDAMGEGLDQLSALSEKKIEAVRKDDLMALDEIMKQEQALALAFRGIEQSQEKLMGQLGWREVSLSKTAERFPPGRSVSSTCPPAPSSAKSCPFPPAADIPSSAGIGRATWIP